MAAAADIPASEPGPPDAPDLSALPRERLEEMAEAGATILECYRVLRKTGDNVVGELLRGQDAFYEWVHYPKGDVYDRETHSQYYYHAHPANLRGGEHGHFHTFVRIKGIPEGIEPAPVPPESRPKDDNGALSHLVGISMDRAGYPLRLFTTNRWVTGETWYAAPDVIALLDRFEIGHAQPSWPVNLWVTGMVCLFRPLIARLLRERDAAVAAWQREHPERNPYEDRNLEIASVSEISVEDQIARIARALRSSRLN